MRRKVIKWISISAFLWDAKLECGHYVQHKSYTRRLPKTFTCHECKSALAKCLDCCLEHGCIDCVGCPYFIRF